MEFNLINIVRENIKRLKPYSSARGEFQGNGEDMMLIDANENPFENGYNRYPDPQHRKLRARIAEIKGVAESHIILGNGSDELINLFFNAFCEPRIDNVIILPPTFGMYQVQANISDIEIRKVELSNDFQPRIDAILDTADNQTKILFLCSPNNPTGNSFERSLVEELLTKFNGIVVIDEAYIDFSEQASWLENLDKYPNLIIIQTLSKAYGMAGIRLGMCFASEAVVEVLNRLKLPYNINELTQQKALEQLHNLEVVNTQVATLLSERDILIKELEGLEIVKKVYDTDANFVLVQFDNANARYQELLSKGIVTRNRSTQPLCDNTLRLTVGTADENKRLIKALKELT